MGLHAVHMCGGKSLVEQPEGLPVACHTMLVEESNRINVAEVTHRSLCLTPPLEYLQMKGQEVPD